MHRTKPTGSWKGIGWVRFNYFGIKMKMIDSRI